MNRLNTIRNLVGCDVLLTDVNEVAWATAFSGDDSQLLISESGAYFFTDSRYTEQAQSELADVEIVETSFADRLHEIKKRISTKTLGINYSRTTIKEFNEYKKLFRCEFKDIANEITSLRAIKTDDEIARMRKGAAITQGAFEHILKYIKEGVTERDIFSELIYYFNKHACTPSFTPIIASGENSSMPHATVTDRKIRYGDFITMDFGVKFLGLSTDFTRTIAVGGIEKEAILLYNTVNSAHEATLAGLRSGITGAVADGVARDIIYNAGYEGYFGHGTGHGVGVEIHESPRLSIASRDTLRSGMVVTVEPGIYIPKKYGVRIEDMVVITEEGYENFYTAQKQLIII